jgi:hypothetical protein
LSYISEKQVTLREALESQCWFRRQSWEGTFEPFAFRWNRARGHLEKAPRGDLREYKISERRFAPFDVLAEDWELVRACLLAHPAGGGR